MITAQLEAEAMDNRVMVEASSRTTAEAKELHGLLQRTREDCNRAHARATQSLLDQESISDELREAKVNPNPKPYASKPYTLSIKTPNLVTSAEKDDNLDSTLNP